MSKLEVICGPMFSGKTEELIRRVKRCVLSHQKVQVFKPAMDHRFGVQRITSHAKTDLETLTGVKPQPISESERLLIDNETLVVAFDEVQFFEQEWILKVVDGLLGDGIRVICAGLDLNTYGEPFGCVPALLARAEEVIKLRAVCSCGQDATRTSRELPYSHGAAIEVGGFGLYEPKCFKCWSPTPRT